VVPILFDSDEQTLRQMFQKINGLFIPGGGADLMLKDSDGLRTQVEYNIQTYFIIFYLFDRSFHF
jgi:hypothetical protein